MVLSGFFQGESEDDRRSVVRAVKYVDPKIPLLVHGANSVHEVNM